MILELLAWYTAGIITGLAIHHHYYRHHPSFFGNQEGDQKMLSNSHSDYWGMPEDADATGGSGESSPPSVYAELADLDDNNEPLEW